MATETDQTFMVAHVIGYEPDPPDGEAPLARTEFLAVTRSQLADLLGHDQAAVLLEVGHLGDRDQWLILG